MKKGFAPILILLIGLAIAAVVSAVFLQLKPKHSPSPQPSLTASPTPTNETVHTDETRSVYTDEGSANWKTYTYPTVFSIKYPPNVQICIEDCVEYEPAIFLDSHTYKESSNGYLMSFNGRVFDASVTHERINLFNSLRESGVGPFYSKVFNDNYGEDGSLTKIRNLAVGGFPAVELFYDYPGDNPPPLPSKFQPPTPMFYIEVYINKNEELWGIESYSLNKKSREERLKTFDEMLSTFKFLE